MKMRMIAGAIVIFAGALLCSAAVLAAPLAGMAHEPALGFGGRLVGYSTGGTLLLIGLLVLAWGLWRDDTKGS
jgi:hypothetical protein